MTIAHSGPPVAWRKSSFCESNSCIEVDERRDGMAVRDSDDPAPILQFPGPDWNHFVAAVNSGSFDNR